MKEAQKILARILAEENINVQEKNSATASFNVVTRDLFIPIWCSTNNYSNNVFNMFLSHEVAHALFSPSDIIKNKPKDIPFNYINVIEDVRIEKLIKRRYLGLISIFKSAYGEIHTDFFKNFNENKTLLLIE